MIINLPERDFLIECTEDYVNLWSLLATVKNELNLKSDEEIRQAGINILKKFLDADLIIAYDIDDYGKFVTWEGDTSQVLAKLNALWSEENFTLNVSPFVEFTATPKGEILGAEISKIDRDWFENNSLLVEDPL